MKLGRISVAVLLLALALGSSARTPAQQNKQDNSLVTNKDIILMAKSKFDDATIIKTIQAFRTDFDVSVAALVELKHAGVTETVIRAMQAKVADGNFEPANQNGDAKETAPPPVKSKDELPRPEAGGTATNPYPHTKRDDPQTSRWSNPSRPRVYLESVSSGSNRNAARDQSMEMAKDFLKLCPNVKITINQNTSNYTIRLNHIEHGLLIRDNQVEVFDSNGDLMRNKEGGSIKRNVQEACDLIYSDWAQQPAQ